MKERIYSESIANVINTFLTEDDWHFSFDEQRGLFKFGLSLKGKIKKINYIIDVKDDEFVVYAISPLGADEDDQTMMASMAEFVCRANYGLVNGNFEFDMRDGEIRFKCFVDCDGITPTSDMVRNSICCLAAMFKRYGAGIVDIIFGTSTAKEAVDKCEKTSEDELRTLLTDMVDEAGDAEFSSMIARLAERLGISDAIETDQPSESFDEPAHIKTDLFGTEGVTA